MNVTLEPLRKAFFSLTKAVNRAQNNTADLEVRDACIQRFEYTYELSLKTIKRFIETKSVLPENTDHMNYRDFLRLAAEMGLVEKVDLWFKFREAHNKTNHAYDEEKAIEVFNIIPIFMQQVDYLLNLSP